MRSRLLARLAGLLLAVGVAVGGVLVPAAPASAHCSGHNTHPDVYGSGGISFGSGTAIRTRPHVGCTIKGRGYTTQGIDVHCAFETGELWLYVRNTSTGVSGWSRRDALRYSRDVVVRDCVNSSVYWYIFA